MKTIHVSHPTTGFKEADQNTIHDLLQNKLSDHLSVAPISFSAFGDEVPYLVGEKEIKEIPFTLTLIGDGKIDEVWVYGPIDGLMRKEIQLAWAKRIPIVCMDKEAMDDFEKMDLPQEKDYSNLRFWVFVIIAVLFIASLLFFLLTREGTN